MLYAKECRWFWSSLYTYLPNFFKTPETAPPRSGASWDPEKEEKNLVERRLAKLSMTTFTYRSFS
jgi:hypothetical protein